MTELSLQTRKQNQIENWHVRTPIDYGQQQEADSYRLKHPGARHRNTPACTTYNCHGLTFASRRTEITSSAQVQKILRDDDYKQICLPYVEPGDIVIYVDSHGDIAHSGLVVEMVVMDQINPRAKVLSKWGAAHEVIHFVDDCPWIGSSVYYYRVIR